jgi:hypothetical protein
MRCCVLERQKEGFVQVMPPGVAGWFVKQQHAASVSRLGESVTCLNDVVPNG